MQDSVLSRVIVSRHSQTVCKRKVKQPVKWYGLHNALSGPVMIHLNSTDRNVLRKTLLTNPLECNKSEKQSRFCPPGWIEYKSGCEEVNCAIKDRTYPVQRLHNFDDSVRPIKNDQMLPRLSRES